VIDPFEELGRMQPFGTDIDAFATVDTGSSDTWMDFILREK
jgi:hypothetical protein